MQCVEIAGPTCKAALIRSECVWAFDTPMSDGVSGVTGCSTMDRVKAKHTTKGSTIVYMMDNTNGVLWWSDFSGCVVVPSLENCPRQEAFVLSAEYGLLSNPAKF